MVARPFSKGFIMTKDGPRGPNVQKYSRGQVRGVVKSSYAHRVRPSVPVMDVNEETDVPDELVRQSLDEVGEIFDFEIPTPAKSRHGRKIASLVGYIFEKQDTFPPR